MICLEAVKWTVVVLCAARSLKRREITKQAFLNQNVFSFSVASENRCLLAMQGVMRSVNNIQTAKIKGENKQCGSVISYSEMHFIPRQRGGEICFRGWESSWHLFSSLLTPKWCNWQDVYLCTVTVMAKEILRSGNGIAAIIHCQQVRKSPTGFCQTSVSKDLEVSRWMLANEAQCFCRWRSSLRTVLIIHSNRE